jgi:hypothetical protein
MTDPKLRQQVLERDGYICQNCDSPDKLHTHHLIPKSKGGKDVLENLITFCRPCHRILEFIDHPWTYKTKQVKFPGRIQFINKVIQVCNKTLVKLPREYEKDIKSRVSSTFVRFPA